MNHIRRLLARLRAQFTQTRRSLKRWWQHHRQRMAQESDYAEALTTVAVAATELATENHRIHYLVHRLAAAYVAVMRAFRPATEGWA